MYSKEHDTFAWAWEGCWLWPVNVGLFLFKRLYEAAGYWQEVEHTVVNVIAMCGGECASHVKI